MSIENTIHKINTTCKDFFESSQSKKWDLRASLHIKNNLNSIKVLVSFKELLPGVVDNLLTIKKEVINSEHSSLEKARAISCISDNFSAIEKEKNKYIGLSQEIEENVLRRLNSEKRLTKEEETREIESIKVDITVLEKLFCERCKIEKIKSLLLQKVENFSKSKATSKAISRAEMLQQIEKVKEFKVNKQKIEGLKKLQEKVQASSMEDCDRIFSMQSILEIDLKIAEQTNKQEDKSRVLGGALELKNICLNIRKKPNAKLQEGVIFQALSFADLLICKMS